MGAYNALELSHRAATLASNAASVSRWHSVLRWKREFLPPPRRGPKKKRVVPAAESEHEGENGFIFISPCLTMFTDVRSPPDRLCSTRLHDDMKKSDLEILSKELKLMKERVDWLEKARVDDAAQVSKHLEVMSGEHATREVLLQFAQEIAAHEGIPVELFATRFEAAKEWHRDRFLQQIEVIDPYLAATVDERDVTEIPTEEQPPRIFPDW